MKSTTAYALAASFLPFVVASPFHQQRHAAVEVVTAVDTVTAYDQVYVTEYADAGAASPTPEAAPPAPATTLVTVAASPSSEAAAPSSSAEQEDNWDGRNRQHNWNRPSSWDGQHTWNRQSSTSEPAPVAPTPTSSSSPVAAPPPASTTSTSTTPPPPPPAPTTTSTSSTPPPPPPPTSTPVVVAPTPATPTTSAAAKATLAPYQTGDASYAKDSMKASTLNSTNVWRYEFSANPLAWNESLASMAQNTANACSWEHTNAGQNYAAGYAGPGVAVDSWGGEYTTFNFANPDFSEQCGHFTQLIWKDSTTMGCAAHKCPTDGSTTASGWFFVCNYFPVGNMLGEFPENLSQKSGLSAY